MYELQEWDGNTGRAAALALQTINDICQSVEDTLSDSRPATEDELRERAGKRYAAGATGSVYWCTVCGEGKGLRWRAYQSSGSARISPHDDGCVGEKISQLVRDIEWSQS
jgi:hypothetical protein